MTEIQTGVCPRCAQIRVLRADGTFVAHQRVVALQGWRRRWGRCDGEGQPPRDLLSTHPRPVAPAPQEVAR